MLNRSPAYTLIFIQYYLQFMAVFTASIPIFFRTPVYLPTSLQLAFSSLTLITCRVFSTGCVSVCRVILSTKGDYSPKKICVCYWWCVYCTVPTVSTRYKDPQSLTRSSWGQNCFGIQKFSDFRTVIRWAYHYYVNPQRGSEAGLRNHITISAA